MARSRAHPGDSGDWNLDAAAPVPMTLRERANTLLDVCSPAQMEAMRKEAAFLAGISGTADASKISRRRVPAGR